MRVGSGCLHTAEEAGSTNGSRSERVGALHTGYERRSATNGGERWSGSNDHVVLWISGGNTSNVSVREGLVERSPEFDELRFRSQNKFIQTGWSPNSDDVVLQSDTSA